MNPYQSPEPIDEEAGFGVKAPLTYIEGKLSDALVISLAIYGWLHFMDFMIHFVKLIYSTWNGR